MKFITPSLIKFVIVSSLLTIVFRFALKYCLLNELYTMVIIVAVIYGLAMCFAGYYFGKKDWQDLPLYDVGFRFHFATFLVVNAINELWFVFGLNSQYEKPFGVHLTVMIWGIAILVHFFFFLNSRKNTIDNLNKKDLFD